MTAFAHGVGDAEELVTRSVRDRRVDAMIVLNLDLTAEFLAGLASERMPIISVDTPANGLGIPSVSIDNRHGARKLMAHMLGHGYRDIVIFTGPDISYDSQGRLAGCRDAARLAIGPAPETGVPTPHVVVPTELVIRQSCGCQTYSPPA